jgi:hypothetical protein
MIKTPLLAVMLAVLAAPVRAADSGAFDQAEIAIKRLAEQARAARSPRCLNPAEGPVADESLAAFVKAAGLLSKPEATNATLRACAMAELDRLTAAQLVAMIGALRETPGLDADDPFRRTLAANGLVNDYAAARGASLGFDDFALVVAAAGDKAMRNAVVDMHHFRHGKDWGLAELERYLSLLSFDPLPRRSEFWTGQAVRDRIVGRWLNRRPVGAP